MICIVQLVCANNHPIMEVLFDERGSKQEKAESELKTIVKKLGLNPWCAICGNHELTYRTDPTGFASVEAAAPLMQATNLAFRFALEQKGQLYDQTRQN